MELQLTSGVFPLYRVDFEATTLKSRGLRQIELISDFLFSEGQVDTDTFFSILIRNLGNTRYHSGTCVLDPLIEKFFESF